MDLRLLVDLLEALHLPAAVPQTKSRESRACPVAGFLVGAALLAIVDYAQYMETW
jgi:hypothetical protein